jgi:hypothetical protein
MALAYGLKNAYLSISDLPKAVGISQRIQKCFNFPQLELNVIKLKNF